MSYGSFAQDVTQNILIPSLETEIKDYLAERMSNRTCANVLYKLSKIMSAGAAAMAFTATSYKEYTAIGITAGCMGIFGVLLHNIADSYKVMSHEQHDELNKIFQSIGLKIELPDTDVQPATDTSPATTDAV